MKKKLLLLSISVMTLWIIGFFLLKMSPLIHALFAISILLYIRSMLCISDSATQKYYRANK